MGFLIRWLFAFILLAATFNPTKYDYYHWMSGKWAGDDFSASMPLAVLLGLLLVIGYIIYLRATLRSIGPIGMSLVLAVVAALFWVLYDWGFLTLENSALNTWLGLFALSAVLGIGLSWSLVRRKLSGQADIDDVDD